MTLVKCHNCSACKETFQFNQKGNVSVLSNYHHQLLFNTICLKEKNPEIICKQDSVVLQSKLLYATTISSLLIIDT